MIEFIKRWLFKDDVERMEWYHARRKDELERRYDDRANYLEMKYAMIERENGYLHKLVNEHMNLTAGPITIKFPHPTDGDKE